MEVELSTCWRNQKAEKKLKISQAKDLNFGGFYQRQREDF